MDTVLLNDRPVNVSIPMENQTLLQTFESLEQQQQPQQQPQQPQSSSRSSKKRRIAADGPSVVKKKRKDPTTPTTAAAEGGDDGKKTKRRSTKSSASTVPLSLRVSNDPAYTRTFHDLVQLCNMCETSFGREERKSIGAELRSILRPAELAACVGNTKHRQIRDIYRTLLYCGAVNGDLARRDAQRRFERYGVLGVPMSYVTDKLMVRNVDWWLDYASADRCEWQLNGILTEDVEWTEPGVNCRLGGRPCRPCAHAFIRVTRNAGGLLPDCKIASEKPQPAEPSRPAESQQTPQQTPEQTQPLWSQPQQPQQQQQQQPQQQQSQQQQPQQQQPQQQQPNPAYLHMPFLPGASAAAVPVARKDINRDSPQSPMSFDEDDDSSSIDDDYDIGVDDDVAKQLFGAKN